MGDNVFFHTLAQLVYRPGYMIADYLKGHRIVFFPPVKTTFIMGTLTAFIMWILGKAHFITDETEIAANDAALDPTLSSLLDRFELWCDQHVIFFLLILHLAFAFITRLFFSHPPRMGTMNISQHFITQVYIISQQLLFVCLTQLVAPGYNSGVNPYEMPALLTFALLLITYKQLFGYGWWATIIRTAAASLFVLVLMIVVVLGFIITIRLILS